MHKKEASWALLIRTSLLQLCYLTCWKDRIFFTTTISKLYWIHLCKQYWCCGSCIGIGTSAMGPMKKHWLTNMSRFSRILSLFLETKTKLSCSPILIVKVIGAFSTEVEVASCCQRLLLGKRGLNIDLFWRVVGLLKNELPTLKEFFFPSKFKG